MRCQFPHVIMVPHTALEGGTRITNRIIHASTKCLSRDTHRELKYRKTMVQGSSNLCSFSKLAHRSFDIFCIIDLVEEGVAVISGISSN